MLGGQVHGTPRRPVRAHVHMVCASFISHLCRAESQISTALKIRGMRPRRQPAGARATRFWIVGGLVE